jgi:NhaP-type Na+/H+ or K+/H+ antiporter
MVLLRQEPIMSKDVHEDLKELGIAIFAAGAVAGAMEAYEGLRYAWTGNPLNEQEAQNWRALQALLSFVVFLVTGASRAKWA